MLFCQKVITVFCQMLQAANVGFCRVLALAKPDAGKLVVATIALLIASTERIVNLTSKYLFRISVGSLGTLCSIVNPPKYGGMIIDIVSTDIRTSEQQSQALDAIKDTILAIVLIVVVGNALAAVKYLHTLKRT
ncbi:abc transporter b family member 27 [Fagus crenata]